MKSFLIATLLLFSVGALSKTVKVMPMQTYIGKEYVNQKRTGNSCVVVVNNIYAHAQKGNACTKMDVSYYFHAEEMKGEQNYGMVQSRVTNYHTKEYPELKSCAEPVILENGLRADADIYGDDTTYLVSPVFNGQRDVDGKEYHYFVSVSKETKEITRAAVNRVSWFSETLYECMDFQDGTPKHY